MWKLKLLVGAIVLSAIVILGMVVNADNSQIVNPRLLGIQLPEASLGLWLFLAMLVGGILGFVVSLVSTLKTHGQKTRLSRKLKHCEQELGRLRTSGLRD